MKTHDLALWWGFACAAIRLNRPERIDMTPLDRAARRCAKLPLPKDYDSEASPFYRLFRLVRPPQHVAIVRDAIWRQLVVDAGFALDTELKRLSGEPAPPDMSARYYARLVLDDARQDMEEAGHPPQRPFRADIDG